MLNEAANRKIIAVNLTAMVKKLKNDRKAVEIISPAEEPLEQKYGVPHYLCYLRRAIRCR
jgi:hypothetical protein